MSNLIHVELLKLRTIRTFWWTLVATLAFVPFGVAFTILTSGRNGAAGLDTTEGFRNVIAAGSWGGILVIVLGIAVTAGEFRFNTITSTVLITPDRRRVLGAKLAASGVVGLGVGVVASLLTLAIALPWLSARQVELGSHLGDIALVLLGAIGATAIGGLIGVCIGALIPNQTQAVTITLVWILFVENALTSFASGIGRWLPSAASNAMSSVAVTGDGSLPVWAGAALFAGYGLAFAVAGSRSLVRHDIS